MRRHARKWAGAWALTGLLAAGLVACGGGGAGDGSAGSTTDPNVTTPTPSTTDAIAVISTVGAPVGAPVQTAVGTGGATLTAGLAIVKVPAGAMGEATVTLQPIADTLNGSGQAIEIASDAAWSSYLTVSLPIDVNDTDPQSLGLAVQQADGSWRALAPVKVDTVAGTVSAGLPIGTEATAAAAPVDRARAQAAGAAQPKRVAKFRRAYLKPGSATVRVNGSLSFTAWVKVQPPPPTSCSLPGATSTSSDDLAPLVPACWMTVIQDQQLRNTLDGFSRVWGVDGVWGGNSTVGTVAAQGDWNGAYTAPGQVPAGGTVTVTFYSQSTTYASAYLEAHAQVRIVDGDYVGEISGSSPGSSAWGGAFPYSYSTIPLTLKLVPALSNPPYAMTYKGTSTGSFVLPKGTMGNLLGYACDSLTLQATFDAELTVATMKDDGTPMPAGTGTQSLHIQVTSATAATSRCWQSDSPDVILPQPIDLGATLTADLSGCGGAAYVPPTFSDITQLSGQIVDLVCSAGFGASLAPFSLTWQFKQVTP